MVGMKLIKATPWHCQTNNLHLDTFSQMLLNVLDLPLSTCLHVCFCLHLKHFLCRSLDLFSNDLVVCLNSFFHATQLSIALFFGSHSLLFFAFSIIVGQIKGMCMQWVAGVIYSHLMCSAPCRGGVSSAALDLNNLPCWESELPVCQSSILLCQFLTFKASILFSGPGLWSLIQCRET